MIQTQDGAMPAQAEPIDISLIVPVYNGARTLEELHQRIVAVMEAVGKRFEVIFVDDASQDNSWAVIGSIAADDPRVLGLLLMRNSGQGNATIAGLRQARGELLVTLDDDLQNPPEEIPRLLEAMSSEEVDVVFGAPRRRQGAFWRRWASDLLNLVGSKLVTRSGQLKMTSFRLMRRQVAEPTFSMSVPVYAPGALLATVTTRMIHVDVQHDPRRHGKSSYSLLRLFRLAIARFLGLSFLPLRLLAVGGFVGVLFSLVMGAIIVTEYLLGMIAVPGWLTLVLLLVIVAGFNFMALGILGECMQSVLMSVRNAPPYMVRCTTEPTARLRAVQLEAPREQQA